ncbi:MAG TPA: sulfite exporter TauE/SafE family protein [Alphaproteobacteria bacterium]|jgi:uncharacterized membrane protein YfcA|nr:sulfite exporter TauE/SafE family protein [Alphaproteobacteria bacterium]
MTELTAALSGALVGFVLSVIGGGGSILAVPLLHYVVGIADPHRALGTAALAVAANAAVNLLHHARAGTVKWPCATVFAAAGVAGALVGARVGQGVDGRLLLLAFAVAMLGVGFALLRGRSAEGDPGVRITPVIAARLVVLGFAAGALSGFLGIGGGFLIVPGLIAGSGMATLNAIGSSLLGIAAFGFATASSYAVAGLVDIRIALLFLVGGAMGGWFGVAAALRLARYKGALDRGFAVLLLALALAVMAQSLRSLGWL